MGAQGEGAVQAQGERWVFFDLETTSADPYSAHIVEAAFVEPGFSRLVLRCRPPCPIQPEATRAHGIRDEDAASWPPFSDFAASVQALVDGAVICGYNIRRFDTVILDRELVGAGQLGLQKDTDGNIVHREVDLYRLWQELEPRTLAGALGRFLGGLPGGFKAHGAEADTEVLPGLLEGMGRALPEVGWGTDGLVQLCRPKNEVDRSGKFRRESDGGIRFAFGKHEGELANSQPGYLQWMLGGGFPPDTLSVCRRLLDGSLR